MADTNQKVGILGAFSKIDVALGVMALLSVLVLIVPRTWLSHSIELNPLDYKALLFNDSYSGGNSQVEWVDKDKQIWRCEIGPKFSNPYCSMQLQITDETGKGFDLRAYNSMKIWLTYSGDAEHIRLYLRNRNARYYDLADITTTKYNTVEIPVKSLDKGLEINMSDFRVAEWWLVQKNIALADSHPDFNDVIFLEIQTGSEVRGGTHQIQLQKIAFTGTLISEQSLYKTVVIIWAIFILMVLLYRILSLKWKLNEHIKRQKELVSINKLLNLQNREFEDLAKTDPLTGLLNRIGIREALYTGLRGWKESRVSFSLVMIDIDHFKSINDRYGHDVGDEVLKAVAQLLSKNVRKTDHLARWGGEEFILVCLDTDLEQAFVVAEQLRKKIQESDFPPDLKVTASFGVASMTQSDLDQLFKSADEALYEAKHQGRNRVIKRCEITKDNDT